MSRNGNQIVFLIHPKALNCKDNVVWQNIVLESVTKLLIYIESSLSRDKNFLIDSTTGTNAYDLKWGYKCAKNAEIKFNCLHQFAGVTLKSLQKLKEEIKSCNIESDVDFSAHSLASNLVAIVHDFQWERLEIISPVKLCKRNPGSCTSNLKSTKSPNLNKSNENFVFVVGPLPKSQQQLNQYFEWQIDSVNDIEKVLMPKHLALHFQQKHNIRFFWLDTEVVFDQTKSDEGNHIGYELLSNFLKAHRGFVVPASVLLHKMPTTNDLVYLDNFGPTLSSNLSTATLSELDCTVGSDAVFDDSIKNNFNLTSHLPTSTILDHFCRKDSNKIETVFFTSLFFDTACQSYLQAIKIQAQELSPARFTTVQQLLNCSCCPNWKQLNVISLAPTERHVHILSDDFAFNKLTIITENKSDNVFCTKDFSKANMCFNMHVIGTISLNVVSLTMFAGSSYLSKPLDCTAEYKKLMTYMRENNLALLIERKLVNEENCLPSIFKNTSIFNQFGILQPLSERCCVITMLSETCKNEIIGLLSNCFTDTSSKDEEISQFVQNSVFNFEKFLSEQISSLLDFSNSIFAKSDAKAFKPSMMESWYCLPATSTKLIETFQGEYQNSESSDDKDIEFRDQIMSELQQIYSSDPISDVTEETPLSKDTSSMSSIFPDFSEPEIKAFVRSETEKCLNVEVSQLQVIRDCASSVVSAVCSHVAGKSSTDEDCSSAMQEKLEELAFVSAAQIRGRDFLPPKKCTQCVFQILLRFEWRLRKESRTNDDDDVVDEIVCLLRIVSLSSNVERMKEFLREFLVETYHESLGEFLVEIHNQLMISLPDVLRRFSSDFEHDGSCFPSSVRSDRPPSSGPFALQSSIGSMDSSDPLSCDRHFRHRKNSAQIKPVTARQIKVPKRAVKMQYDTRRKSVPAETIKRLFPTSNGQKENSSMIPEANHKISSAAISSNQFPEEVNKVRRDLFRSPSKRRRKVESRHASPEKRKSSSAMQRHHSVVDTPAAKQRLTALARQKLRLRRSFTDKEAEKPTESIVEESPLKPVENQSSRALSSASEPKVRRSPRHSIMLTRRHSFYRDGSYEKCRTVARAKVVQQHKEAVPPTPQLAQSSLASKVKSREKLLFSPKSLLFSYTGSSRDTKNPQKQVRPRKRLRLNSVSGTKVPIPVPSPDYIQPDQSTNQKLALKLEANESAGFNDSPGVEVEALPVEKAPSPPFQSYLADPLPISPKKNSTATPSSKTFALPPLQRMQPITLNCTPPTNKGELMSPPKLVLANQVGIRRSPRLASRVSLSPSTSKVGPLDQFVVRTPTPNEKNRPSRPHSATNNRRPSPIGDHIRKWPRRKRLLSTSPKTWRRRQKSRIDKKEAELFDSRSPIKEALNQSCSDVSPGVDVEHFLERLSPRKRRSSVNRGSKEIMSDMGVFPLDSSTKTFKRWTSPRSNRSGTLYHAPVATKKSFVPMVLLHDELD